MSSNDIGNVIPSYGSPTLTGFDLNNVKDGQRVGGSQNGSSRQFVRFYKKIVPEIWTTKAKINEKTGNSTPLETEVRNIEKTFVEIITPGDKNTVDDVAQTFHMHEHRKEYVAFREGKTGPIGMPLDEAKFISAAVAMELNIQKVFTVEQLADSSEALMQTIPDGFFLREAARSVVKANAAGKVSSEVVVLKSQLDASTKAMAAMQAQIDAITGSKGAPIITPGEPAVEEVSYGIQDSPRLPRRNKVEME